MKKIAAILLLFLASCGGSTAKNQNSAESADRAIINLGDSVQIIRAVVSQNKLGDLLEEHDPEQLDTLINNFSFAQMAFESEVLSTRVPLVVLYYFKDSPEEQLFIEQLELLAQEYDNQIKFVTIDADKLFSLAQAADIEEFPTTAFMKERDIFDQIKGKITIDELQKKLMHPTKKS